MPDSNVLLTNSTAIFWDTEAPTGAWVNGLNGGLGAYIDCMPNNLGDQQFVVDKSNFSIGNGDGTNYPATEDIDGDEVWVNGEGSVVLPPEVDRVRITNTGDGGQPGNIVRVFVTLYDDWVLSPGWNGYIDIDIDGGATPWDNTWNDYVWGVILTNGIWPGGNDQTAIPPITPNNGMPVLNSTSDFYLANYSQQTADNWNNYEAKRKQNPNAIPNCIIQQINSPVQNPVDDDLDENGVGYSWMSNDLEYTTCNIQFRIKPISTAWKISIDDFSIMTDGVQRMMINEVPYEEGFAYFSEGEDPSNGVNWWNPFYQGVESPLAVDGYYDGSYPWNPIFNSNNTNTIENCKGIGEPSSQPIENPTTILPPNEEIWDTIYSENIFPGFIEAMFGDGSSSVNGINNLGDNYNNMWPGFTGWLSQNDVNTFIGSAGALGDINNAQTEEFENCNSWDTTTGLINEGSTVKYFNTPIIFLLEGKPGYVIGNPWGEEIITNSQRDSINYEYNIDNLSMNNFYNPYSPLLAPCWTNPGICDEEDYFLYDNTPAIPRIITYHTSDYSLATKRFATTFSGENTGKRWIRTIFMEETNPGENDNNIIVTIVPNYGHVTVYQPGNEDTWTLTRVPWLDPFSGKYHLLQLNGRATPAAQGAPPPINSAFNLVSDSNSGDITVTRTSNSSMSEEVENLLQSNQKNTYSFSARIPNNELTNLATIQVDAREGEYLTEIPYLSINNIPSNLDFDINQNIQLRLSESTSNTSYTFDLMYRNNKSISILENLNIDINFRSITSQSSPLKIRNITFGNQTVNASGENRKITVYGKPGTPFELLVNSVDENLDSDGKIVNSIEESIISGRVSNSEVVISTGETLNQISETLSSAGMYSFNQTIPSTTIKSTAINGSMAASGATKIIFDDLTYVRVGDQVVMKEITSGFITVTELNPDGDNENECTVSASITAADNALVSFKRSRKYRIHVKPGTDASVSTTGSMSSWDVDIDNWSGYYSKDINQYLNPVLTLRASTSESAGVMTMNGATWNTNVPYDLTYIGRPNTMQSTIHGKTGVPTTKFTLTYLLDLVDAGRNFAYVDTVDPAPAYSSNVEFINTTETPQVDWTNTTPELNGGTRINIDNIAITAAGANTVTITANVELIKWGSSSVIMDLNLDNIVSNS